MKSYKSMRKEERAKANLHKVVHPEQREAVEPEQQERVGEAVQPAAQPGASRRRAEGNEHEAAAVPDSEPVVVAVVPGGEAEEVGEAAHVEVAGVDAGLEIVPADGDGGEASANLSPALEDAELGEGCGIVGAEEGGGGARDAAADDADVVGGGGGGEEGG
nr:uncharacterized protein LOC127302623 isoform X3 [Lolium perenne]